MKAHPPGADGKITLSIEYPDRFPVATYAKSEDVRKRLQFESMNRAYPSNISVLDSMLTKRYRLAHMLGYSNWADYITANKMIGNAANAAQFIDRIGKLTREQSQREYEVYLKRKQEDVPGATAVNRWEVRYYEQLIRKRDYNFDPSAARPYFPFEGVKKGVLDVTSKLYGVTYKRIQHPDVWDPSVEAYEVYDGTKLLGRFFFDLHPRAGKFNHAAQFNIRTGVEGVQLPEACLVCNPGREG
jgi:thimet oligopeptidase